MCFFFLYTCSNFWKFDEKISIIEKNRVSDKQFLKEIVNFCMWEYQLVLSGTGWIAIKIAPSCPKKVVRVVFKQWSKLSLKSGLILP